MPLKMRITAVLLLITTLYGVAVQAVPVWTNPATPSRDVSGSAATTSSIDSKGIRSGTDLGVLHGAVGSNPYTGANNNAPLAHPPSHDRVQIRVTHPSHLLKREHTESAVLERRFSIKSAFHHVAHSVSHAVHSVGHAVKKAGHFIAHTGPKMAKVGLKIAATVGQVAGKVAPFIPGVGSVAGKAITAASKKLDTASNAIHVHIGGKLGAVMHGMDKAQHIVGRIP